MSAISSFSLGGLTSKLTHSFPRLQVNCLPLRGCLLHGEQAASLAQSWPFPPHCPQGLTAFAAGCTGSLTGSLAKTVAWPAGLVRFGTHCQYHLFPSSDLHSWALFMHLAQGASRPHMFSPPHLPQSGTMSFVVTTWGGWGVGGGGGGGGGVTTTGGGGGCGVGSTRTTTGGC